MDLTLISKIISRFRYVNKDIINNEELVINDIREKSLSNSMVYPCDVIELRGFLEDLKLKSTSDIPLFSYKFAEKYLKRYPVFLEPGRKKLILISLPSREMTRQLCLIKLLSHSVG